MSLTNSGKGVPLQTRTASAKKAAPMVTLGLALAATLLIVAIMMFSGATLNAFGVVNAAIYVFIVAFASAPLFVRLRAKWTTQSAILSSILGWGLSAPLEALFTTVTNTGDSGADAFALLPTTWLFALVPLATGLGLSMIREIAMRRQRY